MRAGRAVGSEPRPHPGGWSSRSPTCRQEWWTRPAKCSVTGRLSRGRRPELPFADESFDGVSRTTCCTTWRTGRGPGGIDACCGPWAVFASTNGGDHLQEIKSFRSTSARRTWEFRIEDAGDELRGVLPQRRRSTLSGQARGDGGGAGLAFVQSMDQGSTASRRSSGNIEAQGSSTSLRWAGCSIAANLDRIVLGLAAWSL